MSDKPMTANELNAEGARALRQVLSGDGAALTAQDAKTMEDVARVDINFLTLRAHKYGDIDVKSILVAMQFQQLVIGNLLARIEALEAAAREREGDGK